MGIVRNQSQRERVTASARGDCKVYRMLGCTDAWGIWLVMLLDSEYDISVSDNGRQSEVATIWMERERQGCGTQICGNTGWQSKGS